MSKKKALELSLGGEISGTEDNDVEVISNAEASFSSWPSRLMENRYMKEELRMQKQLEVAVKAHTHATTEMVAANI
jgi:DUF1365 family protein